MDETARAACIAAINTYHRDQMAKLVVCSRTTEYEAATEHSRLTLQGAVVVQPLTHSDVDAYLERAGQPLTALRRTLEQNEALHDLATTPLMLNVLILTYQGSSVRDLSNKDALLLQQVWDDYVQCMVERKGNRQRYLLEQTRSHLGWLARQMRDHNQTVFYLEHLQPDWLAPDQQRTYMRRAIRLPAIIIGILISILVLLFLSISTDLPSVLQYGILGGLLGGLWCESVLQQERLEEQYGVWRKRLVKRLAVSACIGLIYGLSLGFNHFPYYTFSEGFLPSSVGIGLSSLLLQYLLTPPLRPGTSSGTSSLQRWKQVVRFWSAIQGPRALLVIVVIALCDWLSYLLTFGLSDWLSYTLSSRLLVELLGKLDYGLISVLISLALNAQMADIRPTERLRWTWISLRRGLFNSRHLCITVLLICIITILSAQMGTYVGIGSTPLYGVFGLITGLGLIDGLRSILKHELVSWLSHGLSFGLSYWFLLGLFQGITQERIEDQDRRVANQGIHRSLRNSVIMGIIGGAIIGIVGILSSVLNLWLRFGLSEALRFGLSYMLVGHPLEMLRLGISGALLIFMLTGGLAVWRHFVIRFLLQRSHTFPGRVPQFLDDATARFLLRRIGGGYQFAHRLLLDHLANARRETNSHEPD